MKKRCWGINAPIYSFSNAVQKRITCIKLVRKSKAYKKKHTCPCKTKRSNRLFPRWWISISIITTVNKLLSKRMISWSKKSNLLCHELTCQLGWLVSLTVKEGCVDVKANWITIWLTNDSMSVREKAREQKSFIGYSYLTFLVSSLDK